MTAEDGADIPIRLMPHPRTSGEPAGLALPLAHAAAVLARLRARTPLYPALRLALAEDVAVLFATEPTPLPWVEAPISWLDAQDALFVPSGFRLDAPAPLRPEIARRLLRRHGLAAPAALLPPREPPGRLRLVDLSASCALRDVDLDRVAALVR